VATARLLQGDPEELLDARRAGHAEQLSAKVAAKETCERDTLLPAPASLNASVKQVTLETRLRDIAVAYVAQVGKEVTLTARKSGNAGLKNDR
jgi:hypothetical protein